MNECKYIDNSLTIIPNSIIIIVIIDIDNNCLYGLGYIIKNKIGFLSEYSKKRDFIK